MPLEILPTLNASLNALATLWLTCGWIAIKTGKRKAHIYFMLMALVTSSVFLGFYLYYHAYHGSTRYEGTGLLRVIYFSILLTHIPLAGLVVPASVSAVWYGYRQQFDRHVRITKWLWPVWMYVSITGVLIYLMLYQW
ncbi:MAG: DUF420 domain-containing protein [Kiritimatiellae bacterium]|nr:DUF420 domain-containing protein [Kiritimatiellia bacterium]